MIRFILGKAGNGKGLMILRQLELELLYSNRWIVTNMEEIDLPKLQEYLYKRHPFVRRDLQLATRLQIIPKSATHHFYRFRGDHTLPELITPEFTKWEKTATQEQKDASYYDFWHAEASRPGARGVVYLIDETHRFFKAAMWADIAGFMEYYYLQLRHLNDVCYFATQFPELVVVNLRRAAEDSFLMRNDYKKSFWVFKRKGAIVWTQFTGVPETKEKNPHVIDHGEFQIEPQGLAGCYRTRGALGGRDVTPELPPNAKKLPFWTIFLFGGLAIVAAIAGAYFIPKAGVALIKRWVVGVTSHSTLSEIPPAAAPAAAPSRAEPEPAASTSRAPAPQEKKAEKSEGRAAQKVVAGVIRGADETILMFEDGTQLVVANSLVLGSKYGRIQFVGGASLPLSKAKGGQNNLEPYAGPQRGAFGPSGTLPFDSGTESIRDGKKPVN